MRRSGPIKSRQRREWEQRMAASAEREPRQMALERVPDYGGGVSGQPVPKDEKAKPGKGAPTAKEREWLDAIVRFGCIACWLDGLGHRTPAVHHILRGGRRMGHLHSIGLCDPGHHQNGAALGMVSRHPWKTRFEAKYGTELELLARLRAEIGGKA